ncbi:MAG: HD domain-containing protein [Lachnospiraceae bacterium]|nr:HD domain-containing protein [Lachnospiraceae bacterium]
MVNDFQVFNEALILMLSDPKIKNMKNFSQHVNSNTLQHSIHVAKISFMLAEKFRWNISEKELVRGAILHDYYQYDINESIHKKNRKHHRKAPYFFVKYTSDFQHGVNHPLVALQNALTDYDLTDKEINIIKSHMWPLTPFWIPGSKEAILVTLADKYCAMKERRVSFE